MEVILYTAVGFVCLSVGINILRSPERNTVFNKRPIEVVDVKKYNRLCSMLVFSFGVIVETTMIFMCNTTGWISAIFTALIVVESFLLVIIYNLIEKKLLKKR